MTKKILLITLSVLLVASVVSLAQPKRVERCPIKITDAYLQNANLLWVKINNMSPYKIKSMEIITTDVTRAERSHITSPIYEFPVDIQEGIYWIKLPSWNWLIDYYFKSIYLEGDRIWYHPDYN